MAAKITLGSIASSAASAFGLPTKKASKAKTQSATPGLARRTASVAPEPDSAAPRAGQLPQNKTSLFGANFAKTVRRAAAQTGNGMEYAARATAHGLGKLFEDDTPQPWERLSPEEYEHLHNTGEYPEEKRVSKPRQDSSLLSSTPTVVNLVHVEKTYAELQADRAAAKAYEAYDPSVKVEVETHHHFTRQEYRAYKAQQKAAGDRVETKAPPEPRERTSFAPTSGRGGRDAESSPTARARRTDSERPAAKTDLKEDGRRPSSSSSMGGLSRARASGAESLSSESKVEHWLRTQNLAPQFEPPSRQASGRRPSAPAAEEGANPYADLVRKSKSPSTNSGSGSSSGVGEEWSNPYADLVRKSKTPSTKSGSGSSTGVGEEWLNPYADLARKSKTPSEKSRSGSSAGASDPYFQTAKTERADRQSQLPKSAPPARRPPGLPPTRTAPTAPHWTQVDWSLHVDAPAERRTAESPRPSGSLQTARAQETRTEYRPAGQTAASKSGPPPTKAPPPLPGFHTNANRILKEGVAAIHSKSAAEMGQMALDLAKGTTRESLATRLNVYPAFHTRVQERWQALSSIHGLNDEKIAHLMRTQPERMSEYLTTKNGANNNDWLPPSFQTNVKRVLESGVAAIHQKSAAEISQMVVDLAKGTRKESNAKSLNTFEQFHVRTHQRWLALSKDYGLSDKHIGHLMQSEPEKFTAYMMSRFESDHHEWLKAVK